MQTPIINALINVLDVYYCEDLFETLSPYSCFIFYLLTLLIISTIDSSQWLVCKPSHLLAMTLDFLHSTT